MATKGISHHTEDPSTGAPIAFFRIVQYTIDDRSGQCYPLLYGYVSESAFDEGKNYMNNLTPSIQGIPPRGVDAKDWMYAELVKDVDAEAGEVPTTFTGGSLVEESEG